MTEHALEFEWAWVEGEWQRRVVAALDAQGRIKAIYGPEATRPQRLEAVRVAGLAVPGMVNAHSHAFQRGMAGAAEYRTAAQDSFWTWRRLMYHFADCITADEMYVLARQTYLEMLRGGYTTVGEFQYLHNDRDGRPFRQPTTMCDALLAAAADVGIRICLLPTLYQQAGFDGRPLEAHGQRRFGLSLNDWLQLLETLQVNYAGRTEVSIGAALHSLRAVDLATGKLALEGLEEIGYDGPLHAHVSEQQREVDECLARHGRRPVELLLEAWASDCKWTLIHATHANESERRRAAAAGAIVGLCPSTEANLGDGVFATRDWQARKGQVAIGSDSHIALDMAGELRAIEYAQRLHAQQRILLQGDTSSCGTWLLQAALRGGATALHLPVGDLTPGAWADFIVLDSNHPILAGLPTEHWLDAFIFAGGPAMIRDVWVGGRPRVVDRQQAAEVEARAAFETARRRIFGEWTG